MAFRVAWSPEAVEDIESIAAYIERDSIYYARAVVGKIVEFGKVSRSFPRVAVSFPRLTIRQYVSGLFIAIELSIGWKQTEY